jgi:predicted acylesterase/phospholipase RssA
MPLNNDVPKIQRALVLQGGGTLGAYEAGVLEVLCKKLTEDDKESNNAEDRLLFDIVAGTSIGAMNGVILVSQFLQTHSWEKAAEKLLKFWTDQLSVKCLDISEISKPWYKEWVNRNSSAASEEAARRYYSVKKLLLGQVRNNMYSACPMPIIYDNKFFDHLYQEKGPNDDNPDCKDPNCKKPNFLNNDWFLHSSKPLQESIQKYAKFPISTTFGNKENNNKDRRGPRLLVFSVDVAEGVTVTFDSYPKADGSRKTEYGRYVKKDGKEFGFDHVIRYNDGITIDHVMASGTLPEFYYYARVPTIEIEQDAKDIRCVTDKSKDNKNIRYFWDGGLLSNTPLRELLDAHRQYWNSVENKGKIPDLDVYIVNVHPSKIDINNLPEDHDRVKDRNNDILYGDRASHYDEKMAHLITDYARLVTQMKGLVDKAISQVNEKNEKRHLDEELEGILSTKTISKDSKEEVKKYEDLIRDEFNLDVVMRIERTNYINSIYGKTGDLTLETINKLIKEGKCDAWFSIIRKEINDMKLNDSHRKDDLIEKLNKAMQSLRNNDYEDNDSEAYYWLSEFIREAEKNIDKSKVHESARLVKSTEALMALLN